MPLKCSTMDHMLNAYYVIVLRELHSSNAVPRKLARETKHVSVMQSVKSETPWAFAFCLSAVLQRTMPGGLQQQPPEPIVHTAGKKVVQGRAGLSLRA